MDVARLGIYGTSYGGATVVFVAAIDPRVKCVVSVVGIGNGARWMRSVRRPDEYHDLLERAAADRVKRALTGNSELADRNDVLLPDCQSAELGAAARRDNPAAVTQVPLEFIDERSASTPNGWSTASRHGRSCSSPPITTAWCRRRRAKPCMRAPASPRSSLC